MLLALILSVPVPGLGHVYARRPRRGLLVGLAYPLGVFFQGALHSLKAPVGLAIFVLWNVGVGLFIIIDASRLGWKRTPAKSASRSSQIAPWGVAALLIGIAVVQASNWYVERYQTTKAFSVSTDSMCPTLCEGDRVIVDTAAFRIHPPGRGDVIVFTPPTGGAPFIKRVIGITGNVVKLSPERMILVDSVAVPRPQACGKTPLLPQRSEAVDFPETVVPSGSLFVVGDNLGNSFDSRIPGFGYAKPEQVIGRPLFLYWSFDAERIGCEIH